MVNMWQAARKRLKAHRAGDQKKLVRLPIIRQDKTDGSKHMRQLDRGEIKLFFATLLMCVYF